MLWYENESSSSKQKMERKSLEFLTDLTNVKSQSDLAKFGIKKKNKLIELNYFKQISLKINH